MWNPDEFKERVAVVTGGSEGIGFAICQALCRAGCEVHFCTHDVESGQAAQASLGPRSHYIKADLTIPEQIHAFASRLKHVPGQVDFLVNNAANDDRISFVDVSAQECDRTWALNLRSYLLVTRAFLELLRVGHGKSIVNIGTTNYIFGFEPFTIYNATKSGIVGFTRSLARELGHEGIRVNMISPGWIMTEKQLRKYVTEHDKEDLLREQSLKFLLEPQYVAPPVMFFLSSAASAISGQNLVVDGGKFMQ